VWATASTRDSLSTVPIVDHGFATSFRVITGLKYWVLASSPKNKDGTLADGEFGSIRAFVNFSPEVGNSRWNLEGVLLGPGDILYVLISCSNFRANSLGHCRYMALNTPHYMVTIEDAIVHGRNMYSTSASQSTSFGIVHSFINGLHQTNGLHKLTTFLRRQMAMWLRRYREDPFFDRSKHPHVPDVLTTHGLKDIMAIGNILELSTVIDRRCYMSNPLLTQRERVEMGTSRSMYRQLQCVISRHYTISVDGKPIHPLLVFRRSLVEFAAAMLVYKEDMVGQFRHSSVFTVESIREKTTSFFEANYPALLPRLLALLKSRFEFMYWTGPSLSVARRTDQNRCFSCRGRNTDAMRKNRPLRDFTDAPLYSSMTTISDSGSSGPESPSIKQEPQNSVLDFDMEAGQPEEKQGEGHRVTEAGENQAKATGPSSKVVTDVKMDSPVPKPRKRTRSVSKQEADALLPAALSNRLEPIEEASPKERTTKRVRNKAPSNSGAEGVELGKGAAGNQGEGSTSQTQPKKASVRKHPRRGKNN